MSRSIAAPFLMAMALAACGSQQEPPPLPAEQQPAAEADTAFGSRGDVETYLVAIDPHIRQVSELHRQMYEVVGSANIATIENLARFIRESDAVVSLQQSVEAFESIEPPPLLAPLHRDIEKMMLLRLEGYELTVAGRETEVTATPSNHLERAEKKLEEANAITRTLNSRLQEVNEALHQGTTREAQANNH